MNQIFKDRESLHKAIYNCTLCKDAGYPIKRVQPPWDPEKGHSPLHKWGMLIGQSPGITELKRSKDPSQAELEEPKKRCKHMRIAFSGDAGCRLGEWLVKDAGFTEDQIRAMLYKTAVTQCFPGRDKRNMDRKPTKREIKNCSIFLREQICLVNPSVLIPIGKVAINWFFPKVKSLDEVVGKKLCWAKDKSKYTVICLPHPSNASGWWKKNKPLLSQALQLLAEMRTSSFPK